MSIQPQGEDVRKAVKWVLEEASFHPEKAVGDLVRDACLKFDLSPIEAEFLTKTLLEKKKEKD